jgi:uncharacterized protein (TIGR02118 family)
MANVKLLVLYPFPTDVEQFEKDYHEHLSLFHQTMRIPTDARPYSITKIHSEPENQAPYYQIFSMPFSSPEALQRALGSPEMKVIADDAARISTGGAPTILVGSDVN